MHPRSILILGEPYSVMVDEDMAEDTYGECDSEYSQITLAPDLEGRHERITVLHETLHGILREQGRPYAGDQEELYVEALASGLIKVLGDNPGLAKYFETGELI